MALNSDTCERDEKYRGDPAVSVAGMLPGGTVGWWFLCLVMSMGFHASWWIGLHSGMTAMVRTSKPIVIELVTRPAEKKIIPAPVAVQPPPVKVSSPPTQSAVPVKKGTVKTKSAPATAKKKRIPLPVQDVRSSKAVDLPTKPLPNEALITPEKAPKSSAPSPSALTRPVVIANEAGADALKHGAEARFMHGLATEEFVEDNYVGEYSLGKLGRVWIEDDRARSGHLVLHADGLGFHRKLFRFNRFIYVYGQEPDTATPVLGSVTFFSDGYHIHQFLWQHNSTKAYFPRRN